MQLVSGHARRGNYSFLMGGALVGILGFAALAVDISLINMAELQAQATADAASHAALLAYRHDTSGTTVGAKAAAQQAAEFMLERNSVAMGHADLSTIRYGQYDRLAATFTNGPSPAGTINAVEVDVERASGNAVNLLLAPMFGVTTHDVDSRSITAQQERAIVLVQDWSCSMNGGSFPRPIDISRRATWGFLDFMVANPQDGDMFGITGYAQFGVAEDLTAVSVNTGPPWAQLSLIETAIPYLREQVAQICNSELGCETDTETNTDPVVHTGPDVGTIGNCTNPGIAMQQAVEELRTRTSNTYFRGMLVMSDGLFNCTTAGWNTTQAALDAVAAANLAYDTHDIHIWTILYHNGSFDADQLGDLTRGLGFAQASNDVADLPGMYAAVAAALPTAIVD